MSCDSRRCNLSADGDKIEGIDASRDHASLIICA